MSDVIRVRKKNATFLEFNCEPSITQELRNHFTFRVDGYKYMKAYKDGSWDGYIRLVNPIHRTLPTGLFEALKEFAENQGRDYSLEIEDQEEFSADYKENLTFSDFEKYVKSLDLTNDLGEKIEPYDYQLKFAYEAIRDRRLLGLASTNAGKSLIIYIIIRWLLDKEEGHKIVLVVPRVSLVKQMFKDFGDYSLLNGWNNEKHCHLISAGAEKTSKKPLVITTWQSFIKCSKAEFQKYAAVIGDEAHNFKAKSLNTIMENLTNAHFRVGTTGTLDGAQSNEMTLTGHFGPIRRYVDNKTLIERGISSEIDIDVLHLKYSDDIRKSATRATYDDEVKFLTSYKPRTEFIRKIALSNKGNTLIAFRFVEHGKKIYQEILDNAPDPDKIFLIYGGTDEEVTEQFKEITKHDHGAIAVVSIGVFSEGLSIRNIHNILIATPLKGSIKLLQLIGRGLRRSTDGLALKLIDIVDDMKWKSWKNYALKHGAVRVSIYEKEDFKYNVHEVKIK